MGNTYEFDLSESASYPAILEWVKSQKNKFQTMHKHFYHLPNYA